jgi:hypothetical protein
LKINSSHSTLDFETGFNDLIWSQYLRIQYTENNHNQATVDVIADLIHTGYFNYKGVLGAIYSQNNNTVEVAYNSKGYPESLN